MLTLRPSPFALRRCFNLICIMLFCNLLCSNARAQEAVANTGPKQEAVNKKNARNYNKLVSKVKKSASSKKALKASAGLSFSDLDGSSSKKAK